MNEYIKIDEMGIPIDVPSEMTSLQTEVSTLKTNNNNLKKTLGRTVFAVVLGIIIIGIVNAPKIENNGKFKRPE